MLRAEWFQLVQRTSCFLHCVVEGTCFFQERPHGLGVVAVDSGNGLRESLVFVERCFVTQRLNAAFSGQGIDIPKTTPR